METIQVALKELNIDSFMGKIRRLQELLKIIVEAQTELQQAGISLNENITTDQEKWNNYLGE